MISTQLKELKDQRKLTNQQLADLAGIPVGTINRILAGQTDNPSFQTVCDIVMALDGSLDELVGIKNKSGQRAAPLNNEIIELYEKIIAGKEKWLHRLFLCCCVLTLFVLGVLIYDLTHPMVGFFRQ